MARMGIVWRDRNVFGDGDHVIAQLVGAARHGELVGTRHGQLPWLEHGLDFHQVGQGKGQLHCLRLSHCERLGKRDYRC